MKKLRLLYYFELLSFNLDAQQDITDLTAKNVPEIIKVGICIGGIHDIDFK